MVSVSLFRNVNLQDLYVCARCASKASRSSNTQARRWIGTKYLAKLKEAELQWNGKAVEIREGKKKSMLTILEERGLVHQIAGDRDELDNLMTSKRIGAYVGIDPTAASLHVGHLLPLMAIFWMYVHGFSAVSLLGGATAKVGDPTGRLSSRAKEKSAVRNANMISMHYQLKKLWGNVEVYGKKYGYNWEWAWRRKLANNNDWMNKLPIMEVLQLLGPGMRMGTMLARDTVKNKMEKGDGMSFAEFTYPLLQAWDWWELYKSNGVQLQIGGSDQYGNIIAGLDAVNYIAKNHPDPDVTKGKDHPLEARFGFTVPLLTNSSGEKFGKSEGNAVWLDQSPFTLYQFFMRISDEDVPRYLRLFTFMPIEEIETVVAEHIKDPKLRIAQHKLASEFIELVHGPAEAEIAASKSRTMFSKTISESAIMATVEEAARGTTSNPNAQPAQITLNNAPDMNIKLPVSLILEKPIGKILHAAGLAESASEGHRLASAGSIYIGGKTSQKAPMVDGMLQFTRATTWKIEDTAKFLIDGKLLVLRKGKHLIKIVEIVNDQEWKELGVKYPGESVIELTKEEKELREKKQPVTRKDWASEFAPKRNP